MKNVTTESKLIECLKFIWNVDILVNFIYFLTHLTIK